MNLEKQPEAKGMQKGSERVLRFFRDINTIGAVALAGIGIILPPGALEGVAFAWAGINAIQALGFEALRRFAESRNNKRQQTSLQTAPVTS